MAPTAETWTPKLVIAPENPKYRTCFDWNDEKLKEWRDNAIKMQEAHVRDNTRTEWFAYKPEQRDAIELRILMNVYGIRMPKDKCKGVPSCPLKTYRREERLHARKLKKVITKHSSSPDKIHFNVIYISTATKPENEDKFYASEEPVFVVRGSRKFVDKDGKVYDSFEDYKQNNRLPKGPMIAPKDGTYTPDPDNSDGGGGGKGDGGDKVPLEAGETPAASFLSRLKAVTDTVAMVGGMILSVAGVVTFFAPALFSAAAMAAIQTGSFILTTYSIVGTTYNIMDKTLHDESIRTEVLILVTAAVSMYTGKIRGDVAKLARAGKTYAEALNEIGKAQRTIFVIGNLFTIASSTASICSAIFDLWNKRERTWLDYYQLCMGIFMFVNVLTKPITIKGVFESEQMLHLNRMQKELKSSEAKESMSKMMAEHDSSDKRAYLIRNLNQIDDRTEFFELIKKTNSQVKCTPDGLTVNEKIDISPLKYNEIGSASFNDKINQLEQSKESIQNKNIEKAFKNQIPSNRREEFGEKLKEKLEEVKNLPAEERKAEIKKFVEGFKGGTKLDDATFNTAWDKAEEGCRSDINKQLNKAIDQLRAGSTQPEQERDFNRLKELETKKLDGTITANEQKELDETLKQCSRHRKEHFFQSTSDHRNDANYDRTMDDLEKQKAGGKNLEEWKMAHRDLDNALKENKITEAEYQREKQNVDDGIAKAKDFREFRNKADTFLNTKDSNQNTFIEHCEKAVTEAEKKGDPAAIASARQTLAKAQELNTTGNTKFIDDNKHFKDKIDTFTNAQNERLCYHINVDQVKSNLQHIYEQPNIEEISINGKKIFANMKIGEYDRLCRVFDTYGSETNGMMTAATAVAQDPDISRLVRTPDDMASITEAIHITLKDVPKEERANYLKNLASRESTDYAKFRTSFMERIDAVNRLDDSIKAQWQSPLTMAYHWWKHGPDFGTSTPITIQQYFVDYSNNLFRTENLTGIAHGQTGTIQHTYLRSFGTRTHIGFTVDDDHKKASHFVK